MSFEWPCDKLEIINSALSQAGDNTCAVADNGSDEWAAASPAYERGLAYIAEGHSWSFTTRVTTLTPGAVPPADDLYDTAYALPPDLVHLIWVRVNDMPAAYEILNNQICISAQGGPASLTIKYVSRAQADPTFGTPTFVLALQTFVMSGIYRGLHEDPQEADKMFMAAKALLDEAKTRHDQQMPKRAMFNSRIGAARLIRRPWPRSPSGWGGTGSPS